MKKGERTDPIGFEGEKGKRRTEVVALRPLRKYDGGSFTPLVCA